ncbi:MAG: hypothetical protein V7713_09940, partial [Marinobacter sp.]
AWLLAQVDRLDDALEYKGPPNAPVVAALFSGGVPGGVASYMAGLGLQPKTVTGSWPVKS